MHEKDHSVACRSGRSGGSSRSGGWGGSKRSGRAGGSCGSSGSSRSGGVGLVGRKRHVFDPRDLRDPPDLPAQKERAGHACPAPD
ncbi:MAG: hypothetical protein DMF96_19410 [Acidobacteria bacterium]|nr:MAG: hypothetical protein DMF96_19410 [Acidobacteriota bacterium]